MSITCGASTKQIQQELKGIVLKYRMEHKSKDILKKDLKEIFDILAEGKLDNVEELVSTILNSRYIGSVKDVDPEFFSEDNITTYITGKKLGVLEDNQLEISGDRLTEPELVHLREKANLSFLDKMYGLAVGVKMAAITLMDTYLFDSCYINRGSIEGLVSPKNNVDLNRNIYLLLDYLLSKITDYLNNTLNKTALQNVSDDVKLILENPKMYINEQYTNALEILKPYLDNYLRFDTSDNLIELYNDSRSLTLSNAEKKKANLKLQAYNAKVFLTHFDAYLPKSINIKGTLNDYKYSRDKYSYAKTTSKISSTWNENEDYVNVEEYADAVTKQAINTTKYYRWNSSSETGRFLNFGQFSHIIGKIKDLNYIPETHYIKFDSKYKLKNRFFNNLSVKTREILENKTLSQVISSVRNNPRDVLPAIFELLSNNEFKKSVKFMNETKFTDDELNIIYSLSLGVFSPSSENSLYKLSNTEGFDVFSNIVHIADSIYNVHFMQYHRNIDGTIGIRTLSDLTLWSIGKSIENRINTLNSIKQYNKVFDNPLIDKLIPNIKDGIFTSLTFDIPSLNLTATVNAKSGTVYLKTSDNNEIYSFSTIWKNSETIKFLDSVLGLNLKNNIELAKELVNKFGEGTICKSLLEFASRVLMNQYVSFNYIKDLGKSVDMQTKLHEIYGNKAPDYNYGLGEMELIHRNDIPIIKEITKIQANLSGITTSAQVKDSKGNGLGRQTTSRLLGSLHTQFDLQEFTKGSASRKSLLRIPGLLEGVFTVKELYDEIEGTVAGVDMNVKEMTYASFVLDFIGGLLPTDEDAFVGNNHILLLPSVNSDKTTIGRAKFNLNVLLGILNGKYVYVEPSEIELFKSRGGVFKSLKSLNSNERKELIAQLMSYFYTNSFKNVLRSYRTLDTFLLTKGININLENDYLNNFNNFINWWIANSHIENGKRIGNTYGEKSPVDFIKKSVLEYNKLHRHNPLELIDLLAFKESITELKIPTLQKPYIAQLARFNPDYIRKLKPDFDFSIYPDLLLFWKHNRVETLYSIIKSKLQINTVDTKQAELIALSEYSNWITKSSGNVIFAKVNINGTSYNISSDLDILKLLKLLNHNNIREVFDDILENYEITLHPLLDQYCDLDYLLTQEFMNCTVGTFTAHPEKSKSNNVLVQEAACFAALHKRNVSMTASMHEFQLNKLDGIPRDYNIAVIEDIKDELSTILGLNYPLKPFDGATYVNPFIVILENNSLGPDKAGITKKLFVHFKNEKIGNGGIIKTAGFGITNDWIRNSPFLDLMMRKMSNHRWFDLKGNVMNIDITRDYQGNKIHYLDRFFTKNGKVYLVEDINVITLLDPNTNQTYYRYVPDVYELALDLNGKSEGKQIRKLEIEEIIELYDELWFSDGGFAVNTNYELWHLFGGQHSMAKKDGKYLEPSNTSVENVVIAMNSIGTVIGNPNKIETQEQLYQPLKHSDIHYVATAGAVKQGAANINSVDKYSDNEEYDFQKIHMYQAGILLDKEHHADDSDLSLMTLVISACALNGYTFEAALGIYTALKLSTELGIKEHLDALLEFFETKDLNAIQEVLMETIIHALSTSNSDNFATKVASEIIERVRSGEKIKFSEQILPLSDNTIYAKIFSTINSYLTNSGIKLKVPGILSVLTPSYDVMKLYSDGKGGSVKYEAFTNPEKELEAIQANTAPIYEVIDGIPSGNISNVELNRTYLVTELVPTIVFDPVTQTNIETIELKTTSRLIRTGDDYRRLKADVQSGKVVRIVEDVKAGRNLKTYNVRFGTTDGQSFQIHDLDSQFVISEFNRISNIKDIIKLKLEFRNLADKYFPNESIHSKSELFKHIRRWVQRDLMNLSNSTPDVMLTYDELLGSLETWQSSELEENSSNASIDINTISNNTASFGVQLTNGSKDFWNKVNDWLQNNPLGIIAYRKYGDKPDSFTASTVNEGWIGNPFSTIERGADTVQQFYDWLTTGNNFGEPRATEEYRLAIINKILNTPKGTNILYYTELNRPSHATVIGYLVEHKELLSNSLSDPENFNTLEESVKIISSPKTILSNEELKYWNEHGVGEMPRILSASERTDPVFHVKEILDIINGKKTVPLWGVVNGKRTITGNLSGKDFNGLYIITKHDGLPMLLLLQTKIPKLIHFSITGLGGTKYEPGVMKYNDLLDRIEDYIKLGLDPNSITIRIDPIIPGVTKKEDIENIVRRASQMGIKRIRFSIMDAYPNTINALNKIGYNFEQYYGSNNGKINFNAKPEYFDAIVNLMLTLKDKYGVTLGTCAENIVKRGISKEGCLSVGMVNLMLGTTIEDRGTENNTSRLLCSCFGGKVDGLAYNKTCASHCIYCYAKHENDKALEYYNEDGSLKNNIYTITRASNKQSSWYDHYARVANIILGTGNGNKIEQNGLLVNVNESNFAEIEKLVRSRIQATTNVIINGQPLRVDKSTLKTDPYGLIMTKTFASAFGLKEFDSVQAIKNDPDFFVKQYIDNNATQVNPDLFAIELKRTTGNHLYLLTKSLAVTAKGLHKVEDSTISKAYVDGVHYRLDEKGNILYQINNDFELYRTDDGVEIIVTNDLNFYIQNLLYSGINLSDDLNRRPSLLSRIVNDFKNSNKKIVLRFYRKICSKNISKVLELNKKYNSPITRSNLELVKLENPNHPILRMGRAKWVSFLRSLQVVAARIPSQSMQSYMPMEIEAFDNPDINTAFVATMQLLLLGSDYDIDSVSIQTYDIDSNGILNLWSPYANIETVELMEMCMNIPLPTGIQTNLETADRTSIEFFQKYANKLFTIESILDNDTYEATGDFELNVDLNTAEKVSLFILFLSDIKNLAIPSESFREKFVDELYENGFVQEDFKVEHIDSLLNKIVEIANNHNLYLDTLSKYSLSKVINNYEMYSTYKTIDDPVNLIAAQTPVDATTEPLKKIAEDGEDPAAKLRTPGNPINKFESISENLIGKKGIAICATGLKSFFAATQHSNYLLNKGKTAHEQERVLLGPDHNGYLIRGKQYRILAGIKALNPNTILSEKVIEALSETTYDEDPVAILSAMLSLSTDNAKELALAKLNAGTKTLGLYVYGISIGMKFDDIADIMMSKVGSVINDVLNGNAFIGASGYNRVDDSLFKYFNKYPWKYVLSYPNNVVREFHEIFKRSTNYPDSSGKEKLKALDSFMKFCKDSSPLSLKLNFMDQLRKKHKLSSITDIKKYNLLIDFLEEYIQLQDVIKSDMDTYHDIITLALGAEEMKTLGQILGLNKGLKNKSDEFIGIVNTITRLIYSKTGNLDDIINLQKFAFDEVYREECIEKYEGVKHSFNILDIVSKVPHYLGYIQTLTTADSELSQSYKYRSTRANSIKIARILNPESIEVYGEDKIIKGILNYIGDLLRKNWMRDNDITIVIPKGNKIYNKLGEFNIFEEDIPIKLGTDWGDLTFKEWFEYKVVPDLKAGVIKPGVQFIGTINNKFILDLGNSLFTHTISRNPIINVSLPINMLPRTDSERTIFNQYKSEFNKLKWNYEWNTQHYDDTGNLVTDYNKLSIIDLFTYYAMIANSWKLGEKSLVPILEDFLNTGIIKKFHEYESELDRSGETLNVDSINWFSIAPYVVPFHSPYNSYTEYILYRDPETNIYIMAEKNLDEKGYIPIVSGESMSLTGIIEKYGLLLTPSGFILKYDLDTNLIVGIVNEENREVVNNILEKLKDTSYYVTKEVGSLRKLFNMLIIDDIINNELNPCP